MCIFRYETVRVARLPVSPEGYLRSLAHVKSKSASKDAETIATDLRSTGNCPNVHETVLKVYTNMIKFFFKHETSPVASLPVSPEGYLRSFDHVKL